MEGIRDHEGSGKNQIIRSIRQYISSYRRRLKDIDKIKRICLDIISTADQPQSAVPQSAVPQSAGTKQAHGQSLEEYQLETKMRRLEYLVTGPKRTRSAPPAPCMNF